MAASSNGAAGLAAPGQAAGFRPGQTLGSTAAVGLPLPPMHAVVAGVLVGGGLGPAGDRVHPWLLRGLTAVRYAEGLQLLTSTDT